MDNKGVGKYDLSAYCKVLAAQFPFAHKLNSMARQSSADRAWAAISRFYSNCKQKIPGKKGFPKFKKYSRSVEYKTSGWKLSQNRKKITFTDKLEIGTLNASSSVCGGTGELGMNMIAKSSPEATLFVDTADLYFDIVPCNTSNL